MKKFKNKGLPVVTHRQVIAKINRCRAISKGSISPWEYERKPHRCHRKAIKNSKYCWQHVNL